jgi:hypothetical protein
MAQPGSPPCPSDADCDGMAGTAGDETAVGSLDGQPATRISIGMVQSGGYASPRNRLESLGYTVTLIPPTSGISTFRTYDLVYLPVLFADDDGGGDLSTIEAHASDYRAYVAEGGGLFVEQPNQDCTLSLLPYPITFESFYSDADYPPRVVDPNHDITSGIEPSDLPFPADQMLSVHSFYDTLVVGGSTGYASLVVGEYGQGRVLIHTAHPSRSAGHPFSDEVYRRMVDWASGSDGGGSKTVNLPLVSRNTGAAPGPDIPPQLTDDDGVAEFDLPEATVRVKLQDPAGQPVGGMRVVLLSNGRKVLMLTEDPQRRFLPSFEESELPRAVTAGGIASSPSYIKEIIHVVHIAVEAVAVGELALDFPEILDYNAEYTDICMTVDQMATTLSVGGGIVSGLFNPALGIVVGVGGHVALPDVLTDHACAYEWPNPAVVRIYDLSAFEGTLMEIRGPCPDEPQVDICTGREECFFEGKVTNARDGSALASVHVQVEPGTEYEAWTFLDGKYTMTNVPQGYHTVTASKEQYVSQSKLINLDCGPGIPQLDFSLSPVGDSNEYRFVLEWGEYPTDLDSHLWLPIFHPYHVNYRDKGRLDQFPYAALDLDDTSSYGPETITMKRNYNGSYMYAVYQFSSSGSLTTSGATVEVYQGEQLLRKVRVPTSGSGKWWLVAYVDGRTGGVSYANQILDHSPGPY